MCTNAMRQWLGLEDCRPEIFEHNVGINMNCRMKKVSKREGACQEVMRCRLCRTNSTDLAVSGAFPTAVCCDNLAMRKHTGNWRVTSVDSQQDLGDPRRRSQIQGMGRGQVVLFCFLMTKKI